jgi:uncharacterized protein
VTGLGSKRQALLALLREQGKVRVAVSGGVDSMTLALLAARELGQGAEICHAISPAVPNEATLRVRQLAEEEGWQLRELDAGEFSDSDYLANPHDRCYFCKSNLYRAIAAAGEGGATILSGANLDDLSDYRPGLRAAEERGVRHPFVECRLGKEDIRALCNQLGYPELARLPASPCLSSRVETGIAIDAGQLAFIHRVEGRLREELSCETVRCRVRRDAVAIELEAETLASLGPQQQDQWQQQIDALRQGLDLPQRLIFEPYRMGSAFVRPE